MLKAFKYELNPTADQRVMLNKTFGCVRYIYNWGLNEKSKAYNESGKTISCFDLIKSVTQMKKSEETSWLKEVHSQPLQMALRNLDNAYTNFFKKKSAFPRFKKKGRYQSFQYPQGVKLKDNLIFLPKIGWVHFYKSRECYGEVKTVTVSTTPTGKYFVSVLCDTGTAKPTKQPVKRETAVGIDVGIKVFAYSSDGEVFENQRFLTRNLKRLRVEQRTLDRRYEKGKKVTEQSNNWHKQRLVVAKLQEKIANQRGDYLHKLSIQLVRRYDSICIEDLAVSNMLKNSKLSKHIAEMGWRTFRTMLEYKCEWYGKNLFVLDRWTPSSKRCSSCGHIDEDLKLSQRTYECQNCGETLDRDFNAALNIKILGLGTQPLLANVSR